MESTTNQTKQPKPKGGKRPGAGRKPSTLKGVLAKLPKITAAMILASINEQEVWHDLLNDDEARIRLDCLKYLTDRRDGKAVEHVKNENVTNADPDELIRELLTAPSGKVDKPADTGQTGATRFRAPAGQA